MRARAVSVLAAAALLVSAGVAAAYQQASASAVPATAPCTVI